MTWTEAYDLKARLLGQPMQDGGAVTTVSDVTLDSNTFAIVGTDFTCSVNLRYGSVRVADGVLLLSGMYGIPDARVVLR